MCVAGQITSGNHAQAQSSNRIDLIHFSSIPNAPHWYPKEHRNIHMHKHTSCQSFFSRPTLQADVFDPFCPCMFYSTHTIPQLHQLLIMTDCTSTQILTAFQTKISGYFNTVISYL